MAGWAARKGCANGGYAGRWWGVASVVLSGVDGTVGEEGEEGRGGVDGARGGG